MRWLLFFFAIACAFAQDERRVSSPDGQVEFRLFVAPQEGRALSRIAYAISYRGKPAIEPSFLGLDIWDQEPLLGENAGLVSSTPAPHSLIAKYMQNGSLGRLLNIEVRVFNDGAAFRYIIPKSLPLEELLIADEATEFHPLNGAAVTEVLATGYPPMHLSPSENSALIARLARNPNSPQIAFRGATPFTGPWRVIVVGPETKCPSQSKIVSELNR
jgi:hypothetical protein